MSSSHLSTSILGLPNSSSQKSKHSCVGELDGTEDKIIKFKHHTSKHGSSHHLLPINNSNLKLSVNQQKVSLPLVTSPQSPNGNDFLIQSSVANNAEALNFISESHIIPEINLSGNRSESRERSNIRTVDMFLTELHSSDPELLRVSLSNSVSNCSNVAGPSHLSDLSPSPILEHISPDFLSGSRINVSKSSTQTFLSHIPSTNTENLALSFSTNFLDNSNMSIDIGSLSEGDAFGSESVDSTSSAKQLASELTFTNALKNVDAGTSDKDIPILSNSTNIVTVNKNFNAEVDQFKIPSVIKCTTTSHQSDEYFTNNYSSAKKKPSNDSQQGNQISTNQKLPELVNQFDSFIEEVSCLKCQLCSYLSLDKNDMNSHVKNKHDSTLKNSAAVKYEASKTLHKNTNNLKKQTGPCQRKKVKKKIEAASQEKCSNKNSTISKSKPETQHFNERSSARLKAEKSNSNKLVNSFFTESLNISTKTTNILENSFDTVNNCDAKIGNKKSMSETCTEYNLKENPVHDDDLGIKCGINGCGLRLQEQINMDYHRLCHHDGYLKCQECDGRFSHWAVLATHLWNRHVIDMELYACDKCSFKSYSHTRLRNEHSKTHETERPFVCEICGKDFKLNKQLRSHETLHKTKKESIKYNCDMCKRKFFEKRMLLLHLEAVHKKVKPFLCNYCGNSFASKSTLNLHIRKHTGEKPFACETCEYRTADHNSMRRHRMKHTNNRPYSCPYCNYSSIQSSTFKVHLRRKHEDRAKKDGIFFSCLLCNFKSVKRDNFLAHVGTHHVIPEDEQNKKAERQAKQIILEDSLKKMGPKDKKTAATKPVVSAANTKVPLHCDSNFAKEVVISNCSENKNIEDSRRKVETPKKVEGFESLLVEEEIRPMQHSVIVNTKDSAELTDHQMQPASQIFVMGNIQPGQLINVTQLNNIDLQFNSDFNNSLLRGNVPLPLVSNDFHGQPIIIAANSPSAVTNEVVNFPQNDNESVVHITKDVIAVPINEEHHQLFYMNGTYKKLKL